MLIVRQHEVDAALAGREHAVIDAVRSAYLRHDEGRSALPHSTFLRFPPASGGPDPGARIIGLPAYLGGADGICGIKWVASFPANVSRGMARASAVMVLNSLDTGHPLAVLNAELISSARTAASAALAADALAVARPGAWTGMTLIGCGPISAAILRYVRVLHPGMTNVMVHDLDRERAEVFAATYGTRGSVEVKVAGTLAEAVAEHDLISLATTASTPYLDLSSLAPEATVLHVSLRDLSTSTILRHHNVVDDAGHVCRERTSLHLAEQLTGGRDFIDAPLATVLKDGAFHRDPGRAVVFSPFGLGVLDLAVAQLVLRQAERDGHGVLVPDFLAG